MTPDEEDAVNQALTTFASHVIPAANAAAKTAMAAKPTKSTKTPRMTRASYAADYAALATRTAHAAHSVTISMGAARAVDAAARAARTARAKDAMRAADAAADAVRAADETGSAEAVVQALAAARIAAVAALRECERTFAPATSRPPCPDAEVKLRKLGRVPRRMVGAMTAMLPAADRPRYREEWEGLLTELPTRRARAREVSALLKAAPRQTWILHRPSPGRRRT
ncbi:hypothetical protein AGRA3207_000568 [Actinomadura graeca]|uniref:Uncharacterized protein n=1 Tax=Actinomadura graeca TaxID=2750812 RepID=A0ABX8QMY0_9ACTN|nr:hypothetical protein [Actinomadura graeca]QXJ19951.1 hypothetical protein AGRA3207_000568 [Actinomadura graeca]